MITAIQDSKGNLSHEPKKHSAGEISSALLVALGMATAPIWLPAVAAKGLVFLSGQWASMTVGGLTGGFASVIKGEDPKKVAKEIAKGAAIGAATGPLEDWLKLAVPHRNNK